MKLVRALRRGLRSRLFAACAPSDHRRRADRESDRADSGREGRPRGDQTGTAAVARRPSTAASAALGPLPAASARAGAAIQGRRFPGRTLDARILVISADRNEVDLPPSGRCSTSSASPTPYGWRVSRPAGSSPARLASGSRAFYQGVILAKRRALP